MDGCDVSVMRSAILIFLLFNRYSWDFFLNSVIGLFLLVLFALFSLEIFILYRENKTLWTKWKLSANVFKFLGQNWTNIFDIKIKISNRISGYVGVLSMPKDCRFQSNSGAPECACQWYFPFQELYYADLLLWLGFLVYYWFFDSKNMKMPETDP